LSAGSPRSDARRADDLPRGGSSRRVGAGGTGSWGLPVDARQGEAERGSAVGPGLGPDASAVKLHDLPADGEADTGAGVLVAGMQPLEDLEHALLELRIEADPVVVDRDDRLGLRRKTFHADLRRGPLPAELHRVADEVLQELYHLQ